MTDSGVGQQERPGLRQRLRELRLHDAVSPHKKEDECDEAPLPERMRRHGQGRLEHEDAGGQDDEATEDGDQIERDG